MWPIKPHMIDAIAEGRALKVIWHVKRKAVQDIRKKADVHAVQALPYQYVY